MRIHGSMHMHKVIHSVATNNATTAQEDHVCKTRTLLKEQFCCVVGLDNATVQPRDHEQNQLPSHNSVTLVRDFIDYRLITCNVVVPHFFLKTPPARCESCPQKNEKK